MDNVGKVLFDYQKTNITLRYLQVYIFYKDRDSRFLYVNQAFSDTLGLKVQDIIGKSTEELFPAEEVKKYIRDDQEVLSSGKAKENIIEPMTSKGGREVWVRTEKFPIRDDNNKVIGLVGIAVDLTMFKAVEEKLRKNESLYRSLFEGSRDGFVRFDIAGRIIECNNAYCNMLGYSLQELKEMEDFYRVTPQKWHEWERKEIWEAKLLKEGFSGLYEKECIRKDGKVISVELQAYCIFDFNQEPAFCWAVVRDITDRKKIEKAMVQQTEIIKQTNDLVIATDLRGYVTYVNKAQEGLLGYTLEELIGKHISFLVPGSKDGIAQKRVIKETLEKGNMSFEVINKTKDGRDVLLESRTFVVKDQKGKPQSLVSISTDITQKKKDEKTLRKNEEQFRLITEGTTDLISMTEFNMSNKFVYINPVHKEILGYTSEDLLGKSAFDYIHPQDKKSLFYLLRKYVAVKLKRIFKDEGKVTERLEFRMRDNKGEWHYLQSTANIVGDKILYISKDITSKKEAEKLLKENQEKLKAKIKELKKAQDMLVQSEKLASLGNLVSDMAHEVNNPLMIISGRAELSLMDEIKDKELANNLKIIFEQCQRAKDIIKRLLVFSRSSRGQVRKMDPKESLELVVGLLEHQLELSGVKVVKQYSALPQIEIDDKQMQEVFMNLLNNAHESMPEGGSITITAFREKDNVVIEISDTGEGISKENLKKMFDPFFTTKKTGTGLGLSVCYGIIKAHGGQLHYKSKIGKGTKAIITLPCK